MSLCLTSGEIFDITGKTQPAAQLRELQRMGIRAYRRKDHHGSVCVVRDWLAPSKSNGAESKPRLKSDRTRAAA